MKPPLDVKPIKAALEYQESENARNAAEFARAKSAGRHAPRYLFEPLGVEVDTDRLRALIEATEEADAMRRRAESAEADWQSWKAEAERLREALDEPTRIFEAMIDATDWPTFASEAMRARILSATVKARAALERTK